MNKYRVTIARLETKVYYFETDAENEDAAREEALQAWDDGEDLGEGVCVHGEDWVQDIEELK